MSATSFTANVIAALADAGVVVHDTAQRDWPLYGCGIIAPSDDPASADGYIVKALVRGVLAMQDSPPEIAIAEISTDTVDASGAQHYLLKFNLRRQ
jgi:hypothetical protein